MKSAHGLVMFLFALAGCNQTPVEAKRSRSAFACLEKAQNLFSEVASFDDRAGEAVSNASDERSVESYRLTSTGTFAFEFVARGGARVQTIKIGCTGDYNAARLESITVNGIIKRPDSDEVWSF